jgi:hypothetical protein
MEELIDLNVTFEPKSHEDEAQNKTTTDVWANHFSSISSSRYFRKQRKSYTGNEITVKKIGWGASERPVSIFEDADFPDSIADMFLAQCC